MDNHEGRVQNMAIGFDRNEGYFEELFSVFPNLSVSCNDFGRDYRYFEERLAQEHEMTNLPIRCWPKIEYTSLKLNEEVSLIYRSDGLLEEILIGDLVYKIRRERRLTFYNLNGGKVPKRAISQDGLCVLIECKTMILEIEWDLDGNLSDLSAHLVIGTQSEETHG